MLVNAADLGMPSYLKMMFKAYPVGPADLRKVLVTNRNFNKVDQTIRYHVGTHKGLVGFDLETEDSRRHDGLNQFMALDPESEDYKSGKKLVFDIRRTTICGFSLYLDGDKSVYYFNITHADSEYRIPPNRAIELLQYIKARATWVVHNFAFEKTMVDQCWGFDLGRNYICTLQMAVSAYNDDEYPIDRLKTNGLGQIATLIPSIRDTFKDFKVGDALSGEQFELIKKVIGKDSVAAHSYNGLVREARYGYGLKEAVQSFFGYRMETFKEALQGKAHMGLLRSDEVLSYGADDAFWCLRLMYALYDYMMQTNPGVVKTFFDQENPLPYIFSKAWQRGMKVNQPAIYRREAEERAAYAQVVREMKTHLQALLPFAPEPNDEMLYRQAWYRGNRNKETGEYPNNYVKLRKRIEDFAQAPDDTDMMIALQTSGSVPRKWLYDHNGIPDSLQLPEKKRERLESHWCFDSASKVIQALGAVNLSYYQTQRMILHDLCGLPFVYIKGKIATDKEARGKLKDKVEGLRDVLGARTDHIRGVLACLDKLAGIEQRIKLYLTPYLLLTDPETGRLYPVISSKLNTRRMASENPNAMQLAKRGESTYVRGFIESDPQYLQVSVDWSQVELVLIGELSFDPEFLEAYGQVPYKDLHVKAATSAISVKIPEFSVADTQMLKHPQDARAHFEWAFPKADIDYVFTNPITKEPLEKPYKFWRQAAGKPSNFGYWYSGSLASVKDTLGWSMDEMWKGTEAYRETFAMAEQWRKDVQQFGREHGYIELPDGHRRTRYEATDEWMAWWCDLWDSYNEPALKLFGRECARAIQRRALNQLVNAKIQGTCATLAKRSLITIDKDLKEEGGEWDAWFFVSIHDELVFQVHHTQAGAFARHLKNVMCAHPDIVKNLVLDGTISIGRNLEPFDLKKAPYGQIELSELPVIPGYIPAEMEDQELPHDEYDRVISYLMREPLPDRYAGVAA